MQKLRNFFSHSKTPRNEGLTLVESLVAISVLVISVFGPMYIVSQAIRTAYLARDQMTAFYLAQESIEYVRNVRDTNSLRLTDPSDWLSGIEPGNSLTVNKPGAANPVKYSMTLDINEGYELVRCGSTCPKINVDQVSRLYGGPTATGTVIPSIYTREVSFWGVSGDEDGDREVVIKVAVRWSQANGNYEYKVQDYLKNWKINP